MFLYSYTYILGKTQMFSLKSLWKPWSGDSSKPPEKDERTSIAESLLLELEYHMKESEQMAREKEQEQKRRQTGVDYSWLISSPAKPYEIPQLERLELEDLCYQVKPKECSKVITLFRDSLLNDPKVSEMPKIFKACIRQVMEQRPKEETLTEWVVKRTVSLSSLKLRPVSKITPHNFDEEDDVESNCTIETVSSRVENESPQLLFRKSQTLPYCTKSGDHSGVDTLPV